MSSIGHFEKGKTKKTAMEKSRTHLNIYNIIKIIIMKTKLSAYMSIFRAIRQPLSP